MNRIAIMALGCILAMGVSSCGGISIPCEVTQTCAPDPEPTPTPTPAPEPTPEPTPEPPSCPTVMGPALENLLVPAGDVNAFGGIVNDVMREISGCSAGRCIVQVTRDQWHDTVKAALRIRGLCATQHLANSDEIAVGVTLKGILEGYHIYAERPLHPGTGTIVFSPQADRMAWVLRGDVPDPEPTPAPTPDPVVTSCGPTEPPVFAKWNAMCPKKEGRWWHCTPLVGPNLDFCRSMGWDREFCPPRPNGHPEREACEVAIMGGDAQWRSDGRVLQKKNLMARCNDCTYIEICLPNGTRCRVREF